MQWSIRLGSIAGTEVKVHLTFLLLLGWYALEAWRGGGPTAALLSVGLLLGIFVCVLAHEFGHILAAKRFGIRTPEVLLWPLGGLAKLERLPERPREEIQVALAGPAVSLLIAVGLGLVSFGLYGPSALRPSQPSDTHPLVALAQTNLQRSLCRIICERCWRSSRRFLMRKCGINAGIRPVTRRRLEP